MMSMKKKIISMIIAAVIVASMSAVSATSTSAETEIGWKTAYTDFLKKEAKKKITNEDVANQLDYMGLEKSFSIYDLDGNGTPELIVFDTGTTIYTYSGGKLVKMKLLRRNNDYLSGESSGAGAYLWWKDYTIEFWYSPSEKLANSYTTGTGYWFYYYKFKDGVQKVHLSGEQCGPCKLTYNGKVHEFGFDEDPVSYNKFISEISARTPKDRIHLGYSFRMNDAEINCAITGGNNYKTLYKQFLKARIGKKDTKSFRLKDISGDGIPELFLKTSCCDTESTKIYTFADNRIVYYGDICNDSNGNILIGSTRNMQYSDDTKETVTYCSNTNTICLHGKSSTYTYMIFYKPEKKVMGKASAFACGSTHDGEYIYVVDGVTVTEDNYNSELNKYVGTYTSLGKMYKITEKNISKVIK